MSRYALAALTFLVFLLQSSVIPFFFNGMTQPDLWLVVVVLATLIFDNRTALTLAVIGGLLQDIVIGNLFGLHLLPYLAIAALYLALGKERYNKHWYISLIAITLASVLDLLLSAFVMWCAQSRQLAVSYIFYMGFPFILVNAAAMLFFHHPLWAMKKEGKTRW